MSYANPCRDCPPADALATASALASDALAGNVDLDRVIPEAVNHWLRAIAEGDRFHARLAWDADRWVRYVREDVTR